jgi:hypothetical protein
MLRLNSLVKVSLAVILGNVDAVISHVVIPKMPIWFIDIYSIPIEYTVVSGVLTMLIKIYKMIRHDRKDMS